MKYIILSALSPRFNTIGTLRIEKLSKYLSQRNEVTIISGMPELEKDSPLFKRTFDIGSSKLIEIDAHRFKRENKNPVKLQKKKSSLSSIKTKIKNILSPLVEYYLPMSPGGMVWHRKKVFRKEVEKAIEDNKDQRIVLYSSFGPWFTTKLALNIKRKYGKKIFWIADFRDPSFNNPHSQFSNLLIFRRSTKKILRNADLITCINKQMIDDYSLISDKNKFMYLPNGFDPIDIQKTNGDLRKEIKNDGLFKIAYTGSFYPGFGRDITPFVSVLKNLKKKDYDIYKKIVFLYAGKDSKYVKSQFRKSKIDDKLEDYGLVDRNKSIRIQSKADLLLLITYTGTNSDKGKGILTGKCYEYLASEKPILMIGSKKWELRELLLEDGISKIFNAEDVEGMSKYLCELVKGSVNIEVSKRKEKLKSFEYPYLAIKLHNEVSKMIEGKENEY